MFDINDIVVRLNAGEDIGKIAQEAADALNAAKERYDTEARERKEREERERREAAARAEQLQKQKRSYAMDIIEAFVEYALKFHPDFFESEADVDAFYDSIDRDLLVSAIDTAFVDTTEAATQFEKDLQKAIEAVLPQGLIPLEEAPQEIKDKVNPILDFLAKNDLI